MLLSVKRAGVLFWFSVRRRGLASQIAQTLDKTSDRRPWTIASNESDQDDPNRRAAVREIQEAFISTLIGGSKSKLLPDNWRVND